ESPLVGRPRFAADDIGGQVRIFVQNARSFQPEQHRHHHQITGAERSIEPIGIPRRAESCFSRLRTRSSTRGKRSPFQGLSSSSNLAVANSRIGGSTVLTAANIYVIARPGIGIFRQARMTLIDMEDNRPCLEEGEIAFLIGRNLSERMKRQMRLFLH